MCRLRVLRRLPGDLQELVLQHRAASTIQRALCRFFFYAHARNAAWSSVRARLGAASVRALCGYAQVRREWRTELASWLAAAEPAVLCGECAEGLWGPRSERLHVAQQ